MKHYLIFCKDDQQWNEYVETHEYILKDSLCNSLEVRDNSMILHKKCGFESESVYIKVTPQTVDSYIPSCLLFKEQIWLCDKEEFV